MQTSLPAPLSTLSRRAKPRAASRPAKQYRRVFRTDRTSLPTRRPTYEQNAYGEYDLHTFIRRHCFRMGAGRPISEIVRDVHHRARTVADILANSGQAFTGASLARETELIAQACLLVREVRPDLPHLLEQYVSGDLALDARIYVASRIVEWTLVPPLWGLWREMRRFANTKAATGVGSSIPSNTKRVKCPLRIAERDAIVTDPARWKAAVALRNLRKLPTLQEFIALPPRPSQARQLPGQHSHQLAQSHQHTQPDTQPDHQPAPCSLADLADYPERYPEPSAVDPTGVPLAILSAYRSICWVSPTEPDALRIVGNAMVASALHAKHGCELLDDAHCELFVAWAGPAVARHHAKQIPQSDFDARVADAFWRQVSRADAEIRAPLRSMGRLHALAQSRALRHRDFGDTFFETADRIRDKLSGVQDPVLHQLLIDARILPQIR